jgi:hypothetical protein
MSKKLSYHVTAFSDKVRIMNQTNSKSLTMTVEEARNLHLDIFALLAKIAELQSSPNKSSDSVDIKMDGGAF